MEKGKPTSRSLGASKKSKNADHNSSRKSADAERNDSTSTDVPGRMLTPIVPEAAGPSATPSTATEEERPPTRIHKNLNVHFTGHVTRIPANDTFDGGHVYDLYSDQVLEGHSVAKRRENRFAQSDRDGKDGGVAKHPFRHEEMAKMLGVAYQQHSADFAPADEVFNAQKSQDSIDLEDEATAKSVTSVQLEERKGELLEATVADDLYPPPEAAQTKDEPADTIDSRADIKIFTQNFGEDENLQFSTPIFQTTIAAKKTSLQNDPKQKLLLPPLPDAAPVVAGGAQKDVTASKMTNLLLAETNKTGSSVKVATTPADEQSDPKASQKSAQPKGPVKGKPAPNPTGSNVRMSHKKDQPLNIVQDVIPVGESPPAATPAGIEKPEPQQVKRESRPTKKFKSWDRLFDFRPDDLRNPVLTTGTGFESVPGPIGMRNQFVEDQIDQKFFQQFFDELVNKWTFHTFGLVDCGTNRDALICRLEAKSEATVLDLLPLLKHSIQQKELPPPATLFDGIAERIGNQLQQAYVVNFPKYDRGPLVLFPQFTNYICGDILFESCNNLTGCTSQVLRPWGHYAEPSVTEGQKKSAPAKSSIDPTVKIIRLLPHSCWPEELFPKGVTKQAIRPRYLAPTKAWTTHIKAQKDLMRDIRKIRQRSKSYQEFVTFFGHPNARKPRPSFLAIFQKAHHRVLKKMVKKPSFRFSGIQFRHLPKAVSCGKLQQPIASEPTLDHRDDHRLPQMINYKNLPWKHLREEALHAYRLASHPKERHFSKSHDNEPEEKLSAKLSLAQPELGRTVSASPVVKEPSAVGFRHTPEGSVGDNVFSILIPEKRTSGGRRRKGSMARSSPDIATNAKPKKGLASGASETLNREWDNGVMKTVSASPNIAKYKLANIPVDFRWSLLKTSTGLDKLSEDTDEPKETDASDMNFLVPDRSAETVLNPSGASPDDDLPLVKKIQKDSLSHTENHPSTFVKPRNIHRNWKITETETVRPVKRLSGPEQHKHVIDVTVKKDSAKTAKRRCCSLRNFVSGKECQVVHPRLQRSVILHKNANLIDPSKLECACPRAKHPGSGDPQTLGESAQKDESVLNWNFWKRDKPFVAVLHPTIRKMPLKGFQRFLSQMDTNSESEVCEQFSVRNGCGFVVSPKTVADIEREIRFHRTTAFVPDDLIVRCLTKLTATAAGSACRRTTNNNTTTFQSVCARMSKSMEELPYCENKALGLLFYLNRLRRHTRSRNLLRKFTGEYRFNHIQRLHLKKLTSTVPAPAEQETKTARPSTEKPTEPVEVEPSGQRKRSTPKLVSQREKSPDEKSLATTETEESIKFKKTPLKVEKKDRIKTAAGDPNKGRAPMELTNKPTEVHSIGFVPGKLPVAVEPEKSDKGGNNLQTIRKNMIPISLDDERAPWWKTGNPDWVEGAQLVRKDKTGMWDTIKSKLFAQIEKSPELLQNSVGQDTQISESDFRFDGHDIVHNHVNPHKNCELGKRPDEVGFLPDTPAQFADRCAKISTTAGSRLPMDHTSDERVLPAFEQLQKRSAYYSHAKRYLLSLMPGSEREVIEAKLKQLNLLPSDAATGNSSSCTNNEEKLNDLVELIEDLSIRGAMSESSTVEDMGAHILVKLLRLELVNAHLEHSTHKTVNQQLQRSTHDRLSLTASKLANVKDVRKSFIPVVAEEHFIATPPASPVRHLSPLRPRQESVIVVAAEDSDSGKKTKNDKKNEKEKLPKKKADEVKKPPTTKGKKESVMQSSHVNLSSPPKKKPPKA